MAKTRIIKRQDKAYIEIPSELAKYDEVELFFLKDGYYLLSTGLGNAESAPAPKSGMDDDERTVLKKLLAIRFENRTPAYVSKSFSEQEREILKRLEQKKFVNLFKGRKYVDGVYNVPDSAYSLVQNPHAPSQPGQTSAQPSNSHTILSSRGFAIIQDKREAIALSEQLAQEMKSGAVVGVKGFDGRFYVVTRDYLNASRAKITAVLKKDSDLPSIAASAKLDPDGCTAVLRLMAENGDIIEKKRGIFASV